jgi:hypothetical protein
MIDFLLVTFDEAVKLLDKSPAELFRQRGEAAYLELAGVLHPDRSNVKEPFQRLQALWENWQDSLKRTLTTPLGVKYTLGEPIRGSVANLYPAQDNLVKIVRSPRNSDLLESEAKVLKLLEKGDPAPNFKHFYPHLIETFVQKDPTTHKLRRTNVLTKLEEGFCTLAEVHDAYPNLHPKDAAWMMRRLMFALGGTSRCGVVHGAVLPENVMIHPEKHGLALVGWSYAVPEGQKLKAIVSSREAFYPEDRTADYSLDIYMAWRLASWLMGSVDINNLDAPRPLRSFVKGCTLERRTARPQDAWKILDEFNELVEILWGPRKFRPFVMPAKGK